jgi:hypothetical protein
MSNAKKNKKKSSGWRPADKRVTWDERRARHTAMRAAEARRDRERLRLEIWRSCPSRRCQRVRACIGDPSQCLEQRPLKTSKNLNDEARTGTANRANVKSEIEAGLPAMSAAEAAAAIAASIVNHKEP